jgi:hypothetical protein
LAELMDMLPPSPNEASVGKITANSDRTVAFAATANKIFALRYNSRVAKSTTRGLEPCHVAVVA